MSGTWSRKRRNAQASSVPPPLARTANQQELPPVPPAMQQQQLQLSRSSEKMFEEAELSGVLTLAGRKLKDFPTSLAHKYNISDLVAADLSSNRLTGIPGDVCEWRSLESLRVGCNALRRVPSNILLLDALTFLDLSNNQLSQLPVSLFELPLEILLLAGNRLESIPREIRQLSASLTQLDLGYNSLHSIPADIALLKMLRVLVLRKNRLDQFPSELCRLSLHTLDLSSNRFAQLPLHIRKMKTLVDLLIYDNPLQSPPANIVSKGREHIFKWMDLAAGGGQLAPVPRSHHSSSTLRALNLGRGISISCEERDAARKSSAPAPVERRPRGSRFNTIGGSDSGYGSTADEQRLSHELVPSCLDDINEYAPSASPDEGIVTETGVSSESVSLKSTESDKSDSSKQEETKPVERENKETLVSLMDVYDKTMAPVRTPLSTVPLAVPEETATPNKNKTAALNGNGNRVAPMQEKPIVNSLDLCNNNTPKKSAEVYAVRPSVPPPGIPTPTANKPISKVAPLVNTTKAQQQRTATTTVLASKTGTGKPAVSKLSPPTNSPSSRRSSNSVSSNKSSSTVGSTRTIAGPVRKTMIPAKNSTATARPRPTGSLLMRPSTSTQSIQKVGARNDTKTSAVPRNRNEPAGSSLAARPKPLTKAQSVETATASPGGSLDALRRVFTERIAVTLPSNRDAISASLSDGVHLCGLLNALRPRAVPTIMSPAENETLPAPKAKRNVDSFLSACRRLGVPEASLCAASDVLGKRNLSSIAKTVLFLNSRIAPPTSKMVTSMADSRTVTHV